MANETIAQPTNFHDSTAWTKLIETAYDKAVEFKRWEQPLFRQFFDKKVVAPTHDSDTYIFTLHNNFDVNLSPLSETASPAALVAKDVDRVSVTVAEYGDYVVDTIRLNKTAFTQPRAALVQLLARQQADKMDGLSKAVLDTSTNVYRTAGRTSNVTVAAGDTLKASEVRKIRNTMDRNLAVPQDGQQFTMVAHPDVIFDIRSESGANTWSEPQNAQNTASIYSGEVGSYMGLRFVQSTRCTSLAAAGAGGIALPVSYVFAQQAVAEVELIPAHTVISPVVDPLKRLYGVGWHWMWGANLYRPEALLKVHSSTSFVAA